MTVICKRYIVKMHNAMHIHIFMLILYNLKNKKQTMENTNYAKFINIKQHHADNKYI